MATAPKLAPAVTEMPQVVKEVPIDLRTHLETLIKLRTDVLRRLVLPDLSVAAVMAEGNTQVTNCHRVTFDVTLSPGLLSPKTGIQPAKVRVTDKVYDVDRIVFEGSIMLPAAGGTTRLSVEFPMPEDAVFNMDFSNPITVEIDPDNMIAESDKTNNKITVIGTCIG